MSKKTGKITKVEKFYIENNSNDSLEDVAKDLNRSVAFVKKHTVADTNKEDAAQDEGSDIGDLMGHKEGRGVTIMTSAASEVADATRPSRVKINQRHKNAIHIIKKK
jgi:hypothetical protein|tara:strand:+ start:1828 stop:2148 length:321 start_codon:yes stop_codon:yes gene_type:complete